MIVYPAIDLKDGFAVRLSRGDMNSAKIYSKEPDKLAVEFEKVGAKWLHIVDLDGAFAAKPINFQTIKKILQTTNLKVQIGGGIRDEKRIIEYLDIGVDRVILGSVALKKPDFVKEMAKKYPIAVGIDAKDGMVAVEGWAEVSNVSAIDLAMAFSDAGVQAIITTDIKRDGMLNGVNIEFTSQIAKASGLETIASGGVSSIDDLISLKKAKDIGGVIIGKAYYEGKIDLKEAIKLAQDL